MNGAPLASREASRWIILAIAIGVAGFDLQAQQGAPSSLVEIRIVSEERPVGDPVSIRYSAGELPTVSVRRSDASPADVALAVDVALQLAKRYPGGVSGGTIAFSPRGRRGTRPAADSASEKRGQGYLARLARAGASRQGIVVVVDTAKFRLRSRRPPGT